MFVSFRRCKYRFVDDKYIIQRSSKSVKVILICYIVILFRVIAFLSPHVKNEPDSKEVEVSNTDPDLHAPEQEQRRRQFPFSRAPFFLALASVKRLSPQSSRISGSTSYIENISNWSSHSSIVGGMVGSAWKAMM